MSDRSDDGVGDTDGNDRRSEGPTGDDAGRGDGTDDGTGAPNGGGARLPDGNGDRDGDAGGDRVGDGERGRPRNRESGSQGQGQGETPNPFESVEEAVRTPEGVWPADPEGAQDGETEGRDGAAGADAAGSDDLDWSDLPDPMDAPRLDENPPVRERLRARTGLSRLQWSLLVSVVLFLPYPVFVYVLVNGLVTGLPFLLFTLGYSIVAMYLYIVL